MENARLFLYATVAGILVMLVGFIGYVLSPETVWLALFVVGLAVMILSYFMLHALDRKATHEFRRMEDDEAVNGYLYYMDGEPVDDGATITDLTRR